MGEMWATSVQVAVYQNVTEAQCCKKLAKTCTKLVGRIDMM